MRDLALARLEGEKERGGEVQVRCPGDIQPKQFLINNSSVYGDAGVSITRYFLIIIVIKNYSLLKKTPLFYKKTKF